MLHVSSCQKQKTKQSFRRLTNKIPGLDFQQQVFPPEKCHQVLGCLSAGLSLLHFWPCLQRQWPQLAKGRTSLEIICTFARTKQTFIKLIKIKEGTLYKKYTTHSDKQHFQPKWDSDRPKHKQPRYPTLFYLTWYCMQFPKKKQHNSETSLGIHNLCFGVWKDLSSECLDIGGSGMHGSKRSQVEANWFK